MTIEVKEFIKRNYEIQQVNDEVVLIKKTFKDDEGKLKYKLRIILDAEGFDPEGEFQGRNISYLRLQTDDRTTVDEIEEFFESAHRAFGGEK